MSAIVRVVSLLLVAIALTDCPDPRHAPAMKPTAAAPPVAEQVDVARVELNIKTRTANCGRIS
jgi:hypothetical protein